MAVHVSGTFFCLCIGQCRDCTQVQAMTRVASAQPRAELESMMTEGRRTNYTADQGSQCACMDIMKQSKLVSCVNLLIHAPVDFGFMVQDS